MTKFESPAVVRRKLQVEFDRNTPCEGTITYTFQRFSETGIVEDKERSARLSKITEEMIEEFSDVIENQSQSSVRTVATAYSISPATMIQHLSLKPCKMHFVQQEIYRTYSGCQNYSTSYEKKFHSFFFFLDNTCC